KERSAVESRYQLEAFMDVLQGSYQQPDEMLARARLLGYALTTPQIVVIFEMTPSEPAHTLHSSHTQWSKRVRDELLRTWPSSWVLTEAWRVTALLPLSIADNDGNVASENSILTRLERVQARLQQSQGASDNLPAYSAGLGRA